MLLMAAIERYPPSLHAKGGILVIALVSLASCGGGGSGGSGGGNVHLADLSQTPPVLSDLGFVADSPRFSPDGATLALIAGSDIQLLDIASGTLGTVLVSNNPLGRVDWFPDGSRLLAGTERGVEIITLGPTGMPAVQRKTILNDAAVIDAD